MDRFAPSGRSCENLNFPTHAAEKNLATFQKKN